MQKINLTNNWQSVTGASGLMIKNIDFKNRRYMLDNPKSENEIRAIRILSKYTAEVDVLKKA